MASSSPSARLLRALVSVRDPEALARVRAALGAAGTAAGAAEALGVSPSTAQRWARELGLARRPGNPSFVRVTQNVTCAAKG